MKSIKYEAIIEPFAERHFIRTFAKKYKGTWDITLSTLKLEFEQVDFLFQKSIASVIFPSEKINICKTEFKIAGSNESRKYSGNRCIIAVYKDEKKVCVLLVYNKTDLPSGRNETVEWQEMIKEHYPEYKKLL